MLPLAMLVCLVLADQTNSAPIFPFNSRVTTQGVIWQTTIFNDGEHGAKFPEVAAASGEVVRLDVKPRDEWGSNDEGTWWPTVPYIRKYLLKPDASGRLNFTIDYGIIAFSTTDQWGNRTDYNFGHVVVAVNIAVYNALDVNLDGFVNGDDFDLMATWFYWGDRRADWNNDGFVNGDDADEFSIAWQAGSVKP